MLVKGAFEKAREYIELHSQSEPSRKYEFFPCVTISRETGAGADIISEKLVSYFKKHQLSNSPEWTAFDKNLIEKVLQDHNLPHHLERQMYEEKHSVVASMMSELLTGEPSSIKLFYKTTQTIIQLARMGNVIIIGRGGNIITYRLKNAFHVRLVAETEHRVKHVQEYYNLPYKEAAEFLKKDDTARRSYLKETFRADVNDPLRYHLVINTSKVSHDDAARLIGRMVRKRFPDAFRKKAKS